MGAIVAELVAATSGIGYLILIAAYRVETALLFSCVVFASLAGLAFFGAVVAADWFVCRRRRPLPDSGASDADVKQIWFDIRAGRQISEELAKRLNRFGIEKLRQGAKEEDFDYIGRLAGSDRPAVRALAFSLLHNFTKRNDRNALDLLKREWETVENVPEADRFAERMQLMWQMLDAPELEIDWHWRIYDFVAANWDAWQRRTLNWAGWGNPDLMLERAVQRLNDPEYPKSKAWAYLLYATLSPDKRSAVALAEEYLESRHPVTRYIADNIVRSGGDFNPNLSEKRRSTA